MALIRSFFFFSVRSLLLLACFLSSPGMIDLSIYLLIDGMVDWLIDQMMGVLLEGSIDSSSRSIDDMLSILFRFYCSFLLGGGGVPCLDRFCFAAWEGGA